MIHKIMILIAITLYTMVLISSVYAADEYGMAQSYVPEYGALTVVEGEILSIADQQIGVNAAGESRELSVDEETMILMNGRPAKLQALRPIADDCYFIGRVWIDRKGMVRMIEAEYRGASVRILSATRSENGGVRLVAEETEAAGEPRHLFETTSDCRGMEKVLSERNTFEAYILFDLHGKVRGIFF